LLAIVGAKQHPPLYKLWGLWWSITAWQGILQQTQQVGSEPQQVGSEPQQVGSEPQQVGSEPQQQQCPSPVAVGALVTSSQGACHGCYACGVAAVFPNLSAFVRALQATHGIRSEVDSQHHVLDSMVGRRKTARHTGSSRFVSKKDASAANSVIHVQWQPAKAAPVGSR